MGNYWDTVNRVIVDADVLLLVLDARFIEETRHREIEEKVKRARKPLIYVMTKSDLADRNVLETQKKRLRPSVFISAKEHWGGIKLRDRIIIESDKAYRNRKDIRVGVLGYPNVGKSSLINLIRGRHSAPTSSISGFTRGQQLVRAGKRIIFIDTPGVIPYKEKDEAKHVSIGTIDYTKAKNPDIAVLGLMRKFPGRIEEFYGVPEEDDKEKTLEAIAVKRNVLKKGGLPDVMRMARSIIKDFQSGKIR